MTKGLSLRRQNQLLGWQNVISQAMPGVNAVANTFNIFICKLEDGTELHMQQIRYQIWKGRGLYGVK